MKNSRRRSMKVECLEIRQCFAIDIGNLSANDLFDTAIRIGRDSTSDLDWLFGDIPFFIDAMVQRGEEDRAREVLRVVLDLFSDRLGRKHPQTLFLAAKLLSLVQKQKDLDAANLLIERLSADAPIGDDSATSPESILAAIAKSWEARPGMQLVTLYCMAADRSPEPHRTELQELAIKALGDCAKRGQLQSRRVQYWLKHAMDLDCLRGRQDFQKIAVEVEKATLIEDTMRFSWNLATIGDHSEAARMLRQFASEQPELANLGTVQYLTARTWAACYETASREGRTDLASEYMAKCNSSLKSCAEVDFWKVPANRQNLASDENFVKVRNQIANFADYSSP